MHTAFPFRVHWDGVSRVKSIIEVMRTHRRSSWLSNFLGFLGQQSHMNSPPILETAGFGMLMMVVGTESFPVASVAGGSRDAGPGNTLPSTGWTTAPGELGLSMDFSW